MQPYVDSGDLAPLYLFYNGPASNGFNSGRFSFYGVSATPTVKIDGLAASYNPSTYPGSIDSRLAVPSYIDIEVEIYGDASSGNVTINVTAEQEPEETYPIRVYSVINEDHETATSAWGGYSGQEMMWIPQEFPLGNTGDLIEFTGPYPQTVSVSGDYDLDPITQPFSNLSIATFVQYASGTRECLNAHYMDLPDTNTGVHGGGTHSPQTPILTAGPNPSSGFVTVDCLLPSSQTGTVRIFDTAGRVVESFPAEGSTSTQLSECGVYFVVLNTSGGDVVRERLTVVK